MKNEILHQGKREDAQWEIRTYCERREEILREGLQEEGRTQENEGMK